MAPKHYIMTIQALQALSHTCWSHMSMDVLFGTAVLACYAILYRVYASRFLPRIEKRGEEDDPAMHAWNYRPEETMKLGYMVVNVNFHSFKSIMSIMSIMAFMYDIRNLGPGILVHFALGHMFVIIARMVTLYILRIQPMAPNPEFRQHTDKAYELLHKILWLPDPYTQYDMFFSGRVAFFVLMGMCSGPQTRAIHYVHAYLSAMVDNISGRHYITDCIVAPFISFAAYYKTAELIETYHMYVVQAT